MTELIFGMTVAIYRNKERSTSGRYNIKPYSDTISRRNKFKNIYNAAFIFALICYVQLSPKVI